MAERVFGQDSTSNASNSSNPFGLNSFGRSNLPSSSVFKANSTNNPFHTSSIVSSPTFSFGNFNSSQNPFTNPSTYVGHSSTGVFGASSASSSSPSTFIGQPAKPSMFETSSIGSQGPFGSVISGRLSGGSSSSGHLQPFLGQNTGSRINSYKRTPEGTLGGSGYLMSISAMPCYECKSHEELRWEDYELKSGGHSLSSQELGSNKPEFKFSLPSTTSSLGTPGHSFSNQEPRTNKPEFKFSLLSTSSSLSTQGQPINVSSFPTDTSTPTLSTPSLSNPNSSLNFSALQTKSPSTGPGFKQNYDSSLPSITSSLSTQSPPFSFPSFSTNMNTPTLSIPSLSNPNPSPSLSALHTKLPSSTGPRCDQLGASTSSNQPLQNLNFPSTSIGWSQAPSPLIKLPVPSENNGGALLNIDQSKPGHSQQAMDKVKDNITAVKDPFGSENAAFQTSIGHSGFSSLVQHGISSMPVADKEPTRTRVSSVLTSRHRSHKPLAVSARRYHPSKDVPKVPFFDRAEDIRNKRETYNYIVPRENPRSVFAASSELIFNEEASPPDHGSAKEYEQVSDNAKKEQIINSTTNSLNDHFCEAKDYKQLIPKLRRSDYFTEPTIEKLASIESDNKDYCCRVKDLVVGRHGYGWVKFYGETDVRGLDLDSLIQFNNQEVIVYGEDTNKPPVGQGRNKAAEVTLLNIKCIDKKTGQRYTSGRMVDSFVEKLKKVTEKQGAEFVSYDPIKEEWKFRVQHF